MRTTIITCDICGTEQPKVQHWSMTAVRCDVELPRDGVNGGIFSGDWCWKCRNTIHNVILVLKGEKIPEAYSHLEIPYSGKTEGNT